MGELAGKTAFVTGAGKGIGRAVAELFFEEGANLVLTDIDGRAVEDLAATLSEGSGSVIAVEHDVRVEAAWANAMEAAGQAFSRLDVLVNNAGIGPNKPLLETSLEDWRAVISANLESVFLGCRFGAEAIRATPDDPRAASGSIVNVSSILGLVGMAATVPYSASKGGVRLMTKSVALEAAANGWDIRVNSVHPGFTLTPLVEDAVGLLAGQSGATTEDVRRDLAALHPIGRLGEAREIAEAVLFLASDRSRFIRGAEIAADGGYTAQ